MCYVDHSLYTQRALKKTVKWSYHNSSFEVRGKKWNVFESRSPQRWQSVLITANLRLHCSSKDVCIQPASPPCIIPTRSNTESTRRWNSGSSASQECVLRSFEVSYAKAESIFVVWRMCPLLKLDHSEKIHPNNKSVSVLISSVWLLKFFIQSTGIHR